MNLKRLKEAEAAFMKRYPGGFTHPEMVEVGKKHKIHKMTEMAAERFAKSKFKDTDEIMTSFVKLVTSSSMVSVFEKPKLRDAVNTMSRDQRVVLAKGLKAMLHGSQKRGFEAVFSILSSYKMAKWTLMTVAPFYYRPETEVFVKPSTTKKIISNLELDLVYKPTPTWEFYEAYREIINKLKTKASKTLSPNNAAFCGFMMMTFDK